MLSEAHISLVSLDSNGAFMFTMQATSCPWGIAVVAMVTFSLIYLVQWFRMIKGVMIHDCTDSQPDIHIFRCHGITLHSTVVSSVLHSTQPQLWQQDSALLLIRLKLNTLKRQRLYLIFLPALCYILQYVLSILYPKSSRTTVETQILLYQASSVSCS